MMRRPSEPVSYQINPWKFIREQEVCIGDLPLVKTETLKQWQSDVSDTVHFEISGYIDKHHQYRLAGKLETILHTICQRCLEEMSLPVSCRFDYVMVRHQASEDNIADGSEAYVCAEDILDLAWFIEEEILLAMPMIAKHDNCNALQAESKVLTETRQESVNPFATLKEMMEAKEKSHGSSTKS